MRRTVLLTLVSDWLPKLVAFLAVVLVARSLGAADFAYYAVALSWLGYAWWSVDLGQAGYSVRALATSEPHDQRRVGSEIFSLYLALAVVVTTALAGLLLLTGAGRSPAGELLLAMSPYLLTYALFPDWWLRARGQLLALGVANWAAVLSFLLAWALLPEGSATGYAVGYGLSPLAGAVIAWGALARRGSSPSVVVSWSRWRRHLQTSLLFGAAGLGGHVSLPLTLAAMTQAGDRRAAGAFALGVRASAAAANALWILLQNCLPRLVRAGPTITLRHLAAAAALPALGIAVGAALWTPVLAPFVGDSYAAAAGHLLLGAGLLVVWGPKYLVEIGLIAGYGDTRRIVMNSVPAVVVTAALLAGAARLGTGALVTVLLVGEGAAVAVGVLLLRRSARTRTTPDEAAQPVQPV